MYSRNGPARQAAQSEDAARRGSRGVLRRPEDDVAFAAAALSSRPTADSVATLQRATGNAAVVAALRAPSGPSSSTDLPVQRAYDDSDYDSEEEERRRRRRRRSVSVAAPPRRRSVSVAPSDYEHVDTSYATRDSMAGVPARRQPGQNTVMGGSASNAMRAAGHHPGAPSSWLHGSAAWSHGDPAHGTPQRRDNLFAGTQATNMEHLRHESAISDPAPGVSGGIDVLGAPITQIGLRNRLGPNNVYGQAEYSVHSPYDPQDSYRRRLNPLDPRPVGAREQAGDLPSRERIHRVAEAQHMHMTMGALPPEAVPPEYQAWQQRRTSGAPSSSTGGANIVSGGTPSWASPAPVPSRSSSTNRHRSGSTHRSGSSHRSSSRDRSAAGPVLSPPPRDRTRPPISNPQLWQAASSRSGPPPSMYPSPSMRTAPSPFPAYNAPPISYAPPPSLSAGRPNIVTAEPRPRLSRQDSHRSGSLAPSRPSLGRSDSRLDRSLSPRDRDDDGRGRSRQRDRDDDRPTYYRY
ncbi:hypothetical protein OHS59_31545 [Streptomyces sp. NBC_00414]|uniref:hypothetical protein n=1 Tax=Streptomyces sp. NBC_00414 TaxID=2975739 RepID=UPI002E215798